MLTKDAFEILKRCALEEELEGKGAIQPVAESESQGSVPTYKLLPLTSFYGLNKGLPCPGLNFLIGKDLFIQRMWVKANRD